MDAAAAWRAEVEAINLARLRWVWMVTGSLIVIFGAIVGVSPGLVAPDFAAWALVDGIAAATFLVAGAWVARQPADSRWRMWYVWLSVAAILVDMNSWYFTSLPAFGQNSDYVLGIVIVSAIVLLPPRSMALALAANHVLFCVALLVPDRPRTVIIASFVDNTAAVVIACVVAALLYRARKAEFDKARLLAASNADLREVMAIAAHDLRSPLLGVRDLLRLARSDLRDTATMERVLDMATDSCDASAALVSRLIEAHAAEDEGVTLQLVPQDLRGLCQAAEERLRATARTKDQRIVLNLPAVPAMARVDSGAFVQVMDNLIGNALKFSPHGASVECVLAERTARWHVDVCDDGPGVPVEERARLFEKFQRGSARPTGGEPSTGLGLFIVRMLVEGMDGHVSQLSRVERGSIFRLEFQKL